MPWKINPYEYMAVTDPNEWFPARTVPNYRRVVGFLEWAAAMWSAHDLPGTMPEVQVAVHEPYLRQSDWAAIHEICETIHLETGQFYDYFGEFHPPHYDLDRDGEWVLPRRGQTLNFTPWNHGEDGVDDVRFGKLWRAQWQQHWPSADVMQLPSPGGGQLMISVSARETATGETESEAIILANERAWASFESKMNGQDLVNTASEAVTLGDVGQQFEARSFNGSFGAGVYTVAASATYGFNFESFAGSITIPDNLKYRTLNDAYGWKDMMVALRPLSGSWTTKMSTGYSDTLISQVRPTHPPPRDYNFNPGVAVSIERPYWLEPTTITMPVEWVRAVIPRTLGSPREAIDEIRANTNHIFSGMSRTFTAEGGGGVSGCWKDFIQAEPPLNKFEADNGLQPLFPGGEGIYRSPTHVSELVEVGGRGYDLPDNSDPEWVVDPGAAYVEIPPGHQMVYIILPSQEPQFVAVSPPSQRPSPAIYMDPFPWKDHVSYGPQNAGGIPKFRYYKNSTVARRTNWYPRTHSAMGRVGASFPVGFAGVVPPPPEGFYSFAYLHAHKAGQQVYYGSPHYGAT